MKALLTSLVLLFLTLHLSAQDRAPSCWLKYQDHGQGDIIMNTMRVQPPSPLYTYYCGLQWNSGQDGGGYCGMQEHPDGRNFIFSIWDPISSSEKIVAEYQHPGTKVESFGGEGTGLKSWNYALPWKEGQWYSFVTRAWDHEDHTMFGFWIFDQSENIWHHLVTMDFPVANTRFNTSTGSFIEDWLGNGWEKREIHHKNGWKRLSQDLSWMPFTSAIFERVQPDNGAANYINNYDGGIDSDHYFMESGGSTMPTTSPSNTRLNLPQTNPDHGFPDGQLISSDATITNGQIQLSWITDPSRSPQFSYHVELYDNDQYTGKPLHAITRVAPHVRQVVLAADSLMDKKTYYTRIFITDIFGNISEEILDHFQLDLSVSAADIAASDLFSCSPNPFSQTTQIRVHQAGSYLVEVFDNLGQPVHSSHEDFGTRFETIDLLDMKNGTYFLKVTNRTGDFEVLQIIKN